MSASTKSNRSPTRGSKRWRSVTLDGNSSMPGDCLENASPRNDGHPAPDGAKPDCTGRMRRYATGQAPTAKDGDARDSSTVPGDSEHGRRLILGLGANDRSAKVFTRLHGEMFAACG